MNTFPKLLPDVFALETSTEGCLVSDAASKASADTTLVNGKFRSAASGIYGQVDTYM